MNEIVVIARFRAKEGAAGEQLVSALRAAVGPTHAEEGCFRYALHRETDDPRNVAMIERWSSREHLERHLESAHIKELFVRTAPLIERPVEISVYETLTEDFGEKGRL